MVKIDIFMELFETDKDKRRRGDALGIFYYISCWFFIVLLLVFSTNNYIREGMLFYLFFDVLCIFFIIIYLIKRNIKRKIENELELFEFPTFKEFFLMIVFVWVIYGLIRLISVILNSYLVNLTIFNLDLILFEYFRIIPTEELVFRGLGMFLIYFIASKFINHEKDEKNKREITVVKSKGISKVKQKKSEWERNEAIIWWIAILITAIIFGLYHFPKYYDPKSFPYFFRGRVKIHIFFPIVYLTLLGIGLGLCRYKYGLVASILLHIINNLFADAIIMIFI